MASITTYLRRTKKTVWAANALRVSAAVLLVMGIIGASKQLTRRESTRPAAAVVRAPAEVEQAQPPQATARTVEQPANAKAVSARALRPAPAVQATAPKLTLVTITGCLEQRDETFRLKDTGGTDVPKARTWKTAFLKKGPAPIQVVDASNRLKLGDHVGQRVNVTGTLVEREMQVRSLRRVEESCSKTPSV